MLRRWFSRDQALFTVPAALLVVAAFAIAWWFLEPVPRPRFAIATGRPDGTYYQVALRYKDALARQGIALDVRPTTGSIENIRLLEDRASGVEVAFVQGGVLAAAPSPALAALGTVYVEPVWLFARAPLPGAGLSGLAGKRVAVGPAGSGTRALAEQLLRANGVSVDPDALLPSTGTDAVRALERGEADAMFLVASPDAAAVRDAVQVPGVTIVSFPRADAHVRLFPFLRKLVLPEGTMRLPANVPASDTVLLGAAVNLVVRRDFHGDLANHLLVAAGSVHGKPGLFELPRQFPSPDGVDVPLTDEARRYYERGPPFLVRYLPFWAATLVDRLSILLLPVVAVLLPLLRSVPLLYRWRIRQRIYRWYAELDAVDRALGRALPAEEVARLAHTLDWIEGEVRQVVVPPAYREEHYHLRLHIEFLRAKVTGGALIAAHPLPMEETRT